MLLAFAGARLNYCSARLANAADTPELKARLGEETSELLSTKLMTYKLPLSEATDLMNLVAATPLLCDDAKDKCMASINGAATEPGDVQQQACAKNQKHQHFEHYLTHDDWDALHDLSMAPTLKAAGTIQSTT